MSHEILGRLAVGGMAELYLARTTHEDGRHEVVVLKRILPHLAEDPEFVRMFRDEAFLAATLDHPNIVHVHDIGQDGEDYFFTMEYVHGENVRTIIKAAQKIEVELPLEQVIQIGLGVCNGLHYAHEQLDDDGSPLGIVHRDVSPTNIIVAQSGEVKIVDFGIAKAAAATHVTQAGMLKGKASYMSPEQCRAEPVDRRSDVFAIGILLYEMTTLTRLFRGDNELAVLHKILTGTIDPPSGRVDRPYDPDLEQLILHALQQKPALRYPTAQALGEELARLGAAKGLLPSQKGLGEFLRDLCGEKPVPWDEDDDQDQDQDPALDFETSDVSSTGMPTSTGNFEDEEDTQVNRRAPNLRTLVPGAPSGWTTTEGQPDDPTGTTNRRMVADASASKPGAGEAQLETAPLPAMRRGARASNAGRPPGTALPRRPTATPFDGSAPRAPGPDVVVPHSTSAPTRADGRAPVRSGRTLAGAGGGLGSPPPARSGRTVPGELAKPLDLEQTMRPPAGRGLDRTMTAGAGSRPLPASSVARPRRVVTPASPPASSSRGTAATSPAALSRPGPGAADRTMALTREQEQELARLGASASPPSAGPTGARAPEAGPAWSPGLPPSDEVDEGARTIALSRSDRIALANSGPKRPSSEGPMKWDDRQDDPLTRTQKSPASPGLTSLTSTQRTPSSAYPNVPPLPRTEVQRPQMRSPSPRPEGASHSLWVPAILIVILALGAAAAWMWAMKIGPFARDGDEVSQASSSQTTEPPAEPPPVAEPEAAADEDADLGAANTEGTETGSSENAGTGTETGSGTGGAVEGTADTSVGHDDGGTTTSVEAVVERPRRRRTKKRRRPPPPPEDDDPPPSGEIPGIKPGRPVPP